MYHNVSPKYTISRRSAFYLAIYRVLLQNVSSCHSGSFQFDHPQDSRMVYSNIFNHMLIFLWLMQANIKSSKTPRLKVFKIGIGILFQKNLRHHPVSSKHHFKPLDEFGCCKYYMSICVYLSLSILQQLATNIRDSQEMEDISVNT